MKKTKSQKNKNSRTIQPGGVAEYIANCPKRAQTSLKDIRAAIHAVAPYFDMPGYSYEGHIYNGMFAWFSFKDSSVRLHVRPHAMVKHKKELAKYSTTKASLKDMVEATK